MWLPDGKDPSPSVSMKRHSAQKNVVETQNKLLVKLYVKIECASTSRLCGNGLFPLTVRFLVADSDFLSDLMGCI